MPDAHARVMRTTSHWMFALFAAVTVAAGWPSAADASHPSQRIWNAERPEGAVAGCLAITVLEGREGLVEIKNMCPDVWKIDSVTCEPAVCEFDGVEIPRDATNRIGPLTFGIDADQLSEGETVTVTFEPKLGDRDNPEMRINFTFEGWTDASHDTADATSDAVGDIANGPDAGGDVAVDSDPGSDASDGEDSRQSGTEDEGCSTAGDSAPTPLVPAVLVVAGLLVRRRTE